MSILVIAEQANGKVKKATFAAVTFARELGATNGLGFNIAVIGAGASAAAGDLTGFGAGTVYTADDASMANYLAMPWAAAASTIAEESGASWVVATGTTTGKDFLPRVAVRLGAGLASDVTGLDNGKLLRPMWAGNVMAVVEIMTERKCVTVRGSDWDTAEPSGGASAVSPSATAVAAAQAAGGKMRFVSFDSSGGNRPELTEADTVVAGGRGLKSEENFHILDDLADAFGAAIGASRAAVDSGYAPNDYQIGQTGKSVAPNLYIAVAISGAIQHLAGMKNSKVIVAINKDEEAPIFQVADYGLVADAFVAVPELAAAVKAAKG
ncbi:MAG: electron transfer flavoprotein alpha subunit [Myxococcota bacterium]|jgi:electron transfer flavoprotein alpha subunit